MSEAKKSVGGRAPWLVATVVGLHVVVIGSVLLNQGCGTLTPREETPSQPVEANMPPTPEATHASIVPGTPAPGGALTEREAPPAPVVVPEEVGPTYTIEKGDSLSSVAYRYGVSWREVAELNGIKDASKIRIGQKIKLPAYAKATPAPRKKTTPKTAAKPAGSSGGSSVSAPAAAGGEYVVKSGDSLSRIASRNGTTIKALREANGLTGDKLRIGQKLVLPGGKGPAVEAIVPQPAPEVLPTPSVEPLPLTPTIDNAAPLSDLGAPAVGAAAVPAVAGAGAAVGAASAGDVPFEYTVKAGEKLADVARMFSVLEQELLTLNGLSADTIKAGDKIKIPMSP